MHISGFRDFLLKPELNRAIQDCGFEHPSEGIYLFLLCTPDILPSATPVYSPGNFGAGFALPGQIRHGKDRCVSQISFPQSLFFPAVFVLAILQQLEETDEKFVHSLVICHTRELAFQISNEFSRFSKHLPHAKCAVFYGGVPISKDRDILSSRGDRFPNVVVGTPGRILAVCSFISSCSFTCLLFQACKYGSTTTEPTSIFHP